MIIPSGGELDGFVIERVPVDGQVSDFRYEWEDVRFVSRVWEREIDGATQVDLKIAILRGARLKTPAALRAFLREYYERDPGTWHLEEFRNGPWRGYVNDSEAFWLVSEGVAITIRTPSGVVTPQEIRKTALSIRTA
ncbi:hypothetical protein [Acrocarpospora corrugata]|nr:hypothetical protein [Acrocarpospora corrugata]